MHTALTVNERGGDFLKIPAFDADVTLESHPLIEGPSTTIGRYKLLELIGEGGMGLVYLAEQQEPIRRRVALKIVKLGMDTKQVIARFEAEKQMLALLDHPNIARVYDAGTTETGRPYFVMEYVKGQSITEYCDQHKTSIEDRLKLFRQVCEGVQYAHQKGIIHRDIKPSNILVTVEGDKAVPKIIDFGIAKAVTQLLTGGTLFTQQGQLLGTPEYMSPEQVDMATQDIDTRSDIYSLGIVLYQLLAGVLPFGRESFEKGGFAEIQRVIQEVDPPLPSTALTNLGEEAKKIAERRKTQVVPLARRLHRELEWIPLKAMRKERVRRYRSASELADDIQNYLNGNPLIAGPETAMYRVKKFVRRHAGSVATVILVAAAIILGLVISSAMYFRAERMRGQAEQAKKAEQEQRKLAETKAEDLRRAMYVNNIQLADSKYREGNISRVRELLNFCPNDLRGWEWNRLNHVSDQSLISIPSQYPVRAALFSIDGKHIIFGSSEGTIGIRDAATGQELKLLRGGQGIVYSLSVSKDTRRIVSGNGDGMLRVWDVGTGEVALTIRAYEKGYLAAAVSPDEKCIASVSPAHDYVVRIWDLSTGASVMTLEGHRGPVGCVAFSPDGTRIASGEILGGFGEIKIWDVATGKELMTLHGHRRSVRDLTFSPDGRHLASTGDYDGTIKVWDVETGHILLTIRGHRATVNSIRFSPDGKQLASGSYDNTIIIWDAESGAEIQTLRGHQYVVNAVSFSPDGKRLFSGSGDCTVKIWDLRVNHDMTMLRGYATAVFGLGFSPDSKRIVSASEGGEVKIWDTASGTELATLCGHYPSRFMYSCGFSPDGKRIVSGGNMDGVKVWDAETREEIETLQGYSGKIALSPDGKQIAVTQANEIKVLNETNGKVVATFRGHKSRITEFAYSPDGKRVASGDIDGGIKVWESATGIESLTLPEAWGTGPITSIVFSPDSNCILFTDQGRDGRAKLWDPARNELRHFLGGHTDILICAAFNPDGTRIVSGSRDTMVKLWDAETQDELMTFAAGSGVSSVAFSPDGDTIAAGTFDGSILLWESTTPKDGYTFRQNAQAARNLVDELYEKYNTSRAVMERIAADSTLNESIREFALRIAGSHRATDAWRLCYESRELLRWHPHDRDACQTALRKAQEACVIEPNDPAIVATLGQAQLRVGAYQDAVRILTKAESIEPNDPRTLRALGEAKYRVGAYEDALKILTKADKIRKTQTGTDDPITVASMSMTLHKLGRTEEAKAALERLRALLKEERFLRYAQGEEAKALLAEAEKLIEGEKK